MLLVRQPKPKILFLNLENIKDEVSFIEFYLFCAQIRIELIFNRIRMPNFAIEGNKIIL